MKVKPYHNMKIDGKDVKRGEEVDVPQEIGCPLESRGLVQVLTHDPPPKRVKAGKLVAPPLQENPDVDDRG